ncbi:MAG: class I SAM-dependent methyltransferase [Pirellulaceae bacterium]
MNFSYRLLRRLKSFAPQSVREWVHYYREGYAPLSQIRALPSVRDVDHLERLQDLCPKRTPIKYDADSVRHRATAQWQSIEQALGKRMSTSKRVVEVGCGEGGLVLEGLDAGYDVYGIDIAFPRFELLCQQDERLRDRLLEGNASSIPFPDESVNTIISIAAFEHYADVEGFLAEVARVLAPGGAAYVSSGGLWNSPWGAHLYNKIMVPWCHLIYDYEVIEAWHAKHRPGEPVNSIDEIPANRLDIPYGGMNQYSLARYQQAVADTPLDVYTEQWNKSELGRFLKAFPDLVEEYGREELLTAHCLLVLTKD